MKKVANLSEEEVIALGSIITHFDDEDRPVRERQIIQWKRLKLFWEGINEIYWHAVAHDWRVFPESQQSQSNQDQAYYDKRVNVFRAYLESIFAALSIVVPPIKCYPDDAENAADISTARAGDKIGQLLFRHNDYPLLWLHGLFIYGTEGMVACYNYSHKNKKYGTYSIDITKETSEQHEITSCPNCGYTIEDIPLTAEESSIALPDNSPDVEILPEPQINLTEDELLLDELMNENGLNEAQNEITPLIGQDVCPSCKQLITPEVRRENVISTSIVGSKEEPKNRVCQRAYGGLYVKIPNYAHTQDEIPYLFLDEEINVVNAIEEYQAIKDIPARTLKEKLEKIKGQAGETWEEYEQWGRLSPQYKGDYPDNLVTKRQIWLRPCAFNYLNDNEMIRELKEKFPDGVCVNMINETFCLAYSENLDDRWTLLVNPMADYLHFDPLGSSLTSIQEITVDLISLVLQTIEHGIGQTFADPDVLNFKAYEQTEVLPGGVFPAKPKSGKSLNDSFHEIKTATLSQEVLPFANQVQQMGQLASGALPTLFGGQLEGSETASEYSMSKAQALQRLQNVWKAFISWWKHTNGKAIDLFIKELEADERDVQRRKDGSFFNVFIRKAELQGKIGKVELEANENLPLTWSQQKDVIITLLTSNNPLIQQFIMAPENLDLVKQAIGLPDFFIPGADDIEKQHEEIQLLLQSKPMPNPMMEDANAVVQAELTGEPIEPMLPSIEIDFEIDNHEKQYEVCRTWLIGEAGRLAKTENREGYENVLLHAKQHLIAIPPPITDMAPTGKGAVPSAKPNQPALKDAPITGENDVQTVN